MGEKTGILWCSHTFNPWISCSPVSEGCKNCYAERNNERFHWVEKWGGPRKRTSEANWRKPLAWAKKAASEKVLKRIFCASLADVFDDQVLQQVRVDLYDLIDKTGDIGNGYIEWLILTKRPENINAMMRGWRFDDTPSSNPIRMGVTAENQKRADERIPILLNAWKGPNFVSAEPLLGPINITNYLPEISWLITGSESGPDARPMRFDWARSLRDQCRIYGKPYFLKQMVVNGTLTKTPKLDGEKWMQFPQSGV
jgi:protein gp37